MQYAYANGFLKHFPGPYESYRDRDGCDDVVGVVCRTTGQEIASMHYWDDHLPRELAAHVICLALDMQIRAADAPSWLPKPSERELAAFRGLHPGPYSVEKFNCPCYGPGWSVVCKTTGRSVISSIDLPRGRTRIAASYIAKVLNELV